MLLQREQSNKASLVPYGQKVLYLLTGLLGIALIVAMLTDSDGSGGAMEY